MNKPTGPFPDKASLLERASGIYDFDDALRGRIAPPIDAGSLPPPPPLAEAGAPVARPWTGPVETIDRLALTEAGYVLPDGPVTGIGEEFRIVKRQILSSVAAGDNRVLICSALPGDGKTFCAVNLALSLAAEKDMEVLLVDADFANPSVLTTLGLQGGAGFMDALADPTIAIEDCVIRTDIPGLAVLPAGRQTNNDTEYLASSRMELVLDRLAAGRPNQIILFDSPPLLAASPASVIAAHVGLALLIVRADKTSESALRDAAGLLKACPQVQLLLNSVKFSASGRRFGAYYGKGE
ncbi:AAA family ATPase [Sphingobium phenoxybenzoativorans]|uniref:AAA family ATPase n=1 Tax=Sphingobium phenoxybenzoativorans TaxID=1592790 RepID=A0A975Q351_9SPHN|nr:AAA family ATPase [Sphingobium phenoxybenzoativorans]QUT07539.1 AAA family ATPase [Sphingobium phenoxybenzoativorans]